MSFFSVIIKNLLRRRWRSTLTVIGIAVGIAAVVALTSLAWGFERTWVEVYESRGTDLIVTKPANRSGMQAALSAEVQRGLRTLPHVAEVSGLLADVFSIENSPAVPVIGWDLNASAWSHLKLKAGGWLTNGSKNGVVIGEMAAEVFGKSIGDKIQIETREYTIRGVFVSSAIAENGSVLMSLEEMQSLTERPGMVNFINLRLTPDTTPEQVEQLRQQIKTEFKGLIALTPAEVPGTNLGIRLGKAMSIATSLIALCVGAIGVMNTILMSVFERLHEIGILLAIGWKRTRVLKMILMESMILGAAGGVVGCVSGAVALRALQLNSWIHGRISGEVPLPVIGFALLAAVAIGAFGGIYPAWRASRMSPLSALRYE